MESSLNKSISKQCMKRPFKPWSVIALLGSLGCLCYMFERSYKDYLSFESADIVSFNEQLHENNVGVLQENIASFTPTEGREETQASVLNDSWVHAMEYLQRMQKEENYESLFYKVNLQEEFKDVVSGFPTNPLPDFKNPCWISRVNLGNPYQTKTRLRSGALRLRCLPYAMVPGVSKSGTTDLAARINSHPDVFPSGGEIRFWNRRRIGRLRLGGKGSSNMSFVQYVNRIDVAAKNINASFTEKKGQRYHRGITIDKTPHYFWDYEGWENIPGNAGMTEPKFILAHTLRRLMPDLKMIIIARNPTDRLYSQFRMLSANVPSEVFHELVTKSLSLWNDCVKRLNIRSCAYNATLIPWEYKHPGGMTLRAGMYSVYLQDWMEVFPRQQILLLKGEDYYSHMISTLYQVFRFLDLDESEAERELLEGTLNRKIKNSKESNKRSLEPMLDATRKILDAFYEPFNKKLASILKDDRFLWK